MYSSHAIPHFLSFITTAFVPNNKGQSSISRCFCSSPSRHLGGSWSSVFSHGSARLVVACLSGKGNLSLSFGWYAVVAADSGLLLEIAGRLLQAVVALLVCAAGTETDTDESGPGAPPEEEDGEDNRESTPSPAGEEPEAPLSYTHSPSSLKRKRMQELAQQRQKRGRH